jgi:hypothetical protein
MEILEQDHCGSLRRHVVQELDPGVMQAVAHRERMKLAGDVEPERQG